MIMPRKTFCDVRSTSEEEEPYTFFELSDAVVVYQDFTYFGRIARIEKFSELKFFDVWFTNGNYKRLMLNNYYAQKLRIWIATSQNEKVQNLLGQRCERTRRTDMPESSQNPYFVHV